MEVNASQTQPMTPALLLRQREALIACQSWRRGSRPEKISDATDALRRAAVPSDRPQVSIMGVQRI